MWDLKHSAPVRPPHDGSADHSTGRWAAKAEHVARPSAVAVFCLLWAAAGSVAARERDGTITLAEPPPPEVEIAALIEQVRSPDAETRAQACWEISRNWHWYGAYKETSPLRPQLAQVLTGAVTDPEWKVRHAATDALIRTVGEAEAIVPILIERLGSGETTRERAGAAGHLALLGVEADAAAGALEEALEDDLMVRAAAAYALYRQGWRADRVVPITMKALKEGDSRARWGAAEIVLSIGPSAATAGPVLVERLAKDEHSSVRYRAAQGLPWVHVGPAQAVPALARALGDREWDVREVAASSLGVYGRHAKAAVPDLVTALGDHDRRVRIAAAEALGEIGPDAKAAIPELLAEARSKRHSALRQRAISALAAIAPREKAVLATFVDALEYEPWAAAAALGEAGPSGVPALIEALPKHRPAVIIALRNMGAHAKAAVPALLGLLRTKEGGDRREIIEVLGKIGPAAMEAVPVLAELAGADEWRTRLEAAVALARITDGAKGIDVLVADLASPDNRVAGRAIGWLSACGPLASPAVPWLTRALADEDDVRRRSAANTLGAIGAAARSASPELVKLLKDDAPETGAEAARALVRIGKAQVGLEHLIGRLRDRDKVSRMRAAEHLGSLGLLAAPALPELRRATGDRFREVNDHILAARRKIELALRREADKKDRGGAPVQSR